MTLRDPELRAFSTSADYITTFYASTPALWIAYRGDPCFCDECAPRITRGMGKTEADAIADLKEQEQDA